MSQSTEGILKEAEQVVERVADEVAAPPPRRFKRMRALLLDPERRHRALFVSGLGALGVVGALAYGTYRVQTLPFDLRATLGLQRFRGGAIYDFMVGVSWFGYDPQSVVVVLAALAMVWWKLGWRDSLFLITAVGLQGLSNHLIKVGIGRPRPTEDLVEILLPSAGNSFPSGHVMFYTVFFGFLFFLAWTRMGRGLMRGVALALSGALVLLVGPSRIYLGAHWFSDVIAAYLIGFVFLLFSIEFYVHLIQNPRPSRLAKG